MLYKIWKLFKLYPLCLDDMTHKFNAKNYVHKYPSSFAYENITSSIVCRLTGQWHYSPSMKDFLPVWARIYFSRGENQTDFCGWISNVLSLCSRHEYISWYYRTSAYFIAKLMADLIPIRTMPSIIFTCIVYFMLGKCGLLQSHSTPLHNSPWCVHLIDVYAHLDISIKPCTGVAAVAELTFSTPCCFLQKRHKDLSIHQRTWDVSSPLSPEGSHNHYYIVLIYSFSFMAFLASDEFYKVIFWSLQEHLKEKF